MNERRKRKVAALANHPATPKHEKETARRRLEEQKTTPEAFQTPELPPVQMGMGNIVYQRPSNLNEGQMPGSIWQPYVPKVTGKE